MRKVSFVFSSIPISYGSIPISCGLSLVKPVGAFLLVLIDLLEKCSHRGGIDSNELILGRQLAINGSSMDIEFSIETGLKGLKLVLGCEGGRLMLLLAGLKVVLQTSVKCL